MLHAERSSLARRWVNGLSAIILACALFGGFVTSASAYSSFTISEIKAEGLQRLDLGTILSYLPLSVGDELNTLSGQQALRALYRTGLFRDVAMERDGTTLIVRVAERPAITSFEIEGNKKVGGEELDKALKDAGLSEGELFRQVILDQVQQELQRQYYANGFYGVRIDSKVTEEPNNRVSIKIDVTEGTVAKIKTINIVGNTVFDEDDLLDVMKLKSTSGIPFQSSNRYSKQQLRGDLEALSSYYQDRGYLKATIDSVQVSISPDKEDIYLTLNVVEGDIYTVKDFRFTGDLILDESVMRRLVFIRPGGTFSRRLATESANTLTAALSNIGYAFAEARPVPELEPDSKEVTINFVVEPGRQAYVRHIDFSGHLKTNDETLRREMRQLEGAVFSRSQVERGRTRLSRLPFVQEAQVETEPVPGSDDLVDIKYTISERPPGSVQFGVGFSGSQGFLINGSITHTNFFGTGNRITAEIENNEVAKVFSFSWTDPYATQDGVSRTVAAFFRDSEQIIRFSSGFDSSAVGASLTYGFPLSEYSSLRLGVGAEQTALTTFANNTADEVLEFVVRNGSNFFTWDFRTGLARDTRNRTIFATRGSLQRLNIDITLPGSDLEFFTAFYRHIQYIPLGKWFNIEFSGSIGYAEGIGSSDVPPYERFFAGGTSSVRGYRDGTLGPRDTPFFNPFGGTLRTVAQTELILPSPLESNNKSTRFSLFYDIGNTFDEPQDFEFDELRSSVGIAFEWFTPFLGLLQLSYAFPLEDQVGDELDRFQINFGRGF